MRTSLVVGSLLLALGLSAQAAEAPPENLFTLPLSAYKISDKDPAQRLYVKPGASLKGYQSVMIEPLLFLRRNQDGQWELLESGEEGRIAAYYQQRMQEALAKAGVTVAQAANADVLRLRVAVSAVGQARPGMDPVDILPVKAVFNLARMAAGKEPYLPRVSSLAQLEDSQSGELLAGAVNLRETAKTKHKDEKLTLEHLQKTIDATCRQSAQQLAQALNARQP